MPSNFSFKIFAHDLPSSRFSINLALLPLRRWRERVNFYIQEYSFYNNSTCRRIFLSTRKRDKVELVHLCEFYDLPAFNISPTGYEFHLLLSILRRQWKADQWTAWINVPLPFQHVPFTWDAQVLRTRSSWKHTWKVLQQKDFHAEGQAMRRFLIPAFHTPPITRKLQGQLCT